VIAAWTQITKGVCIGVKQENQMSRIFGAVCQNGYVVRDIGKAMDHWINVMGVGPWYYAERVVAKNFRHRGQDSAVEMSIALANSGDLQIELIQQHNDAPSMYKEFLDSGREGLHHMSYWTTDYDALYQRALSLGYKVGHEGASPRGRFAYFDTEFHPGTVIEISDVSGAKGQFFAQVRQAAIDWDGTRPIRGFREIGVSKQ
jgi:glyoxalase/bleomycin resistance protein/dioxygenase superfamily protein